LRSRLHIGGAGACPPQLQLQHLAQADRHIALSDKNIARQVEIIAELESKGHSVVLANELLATFYAVRDTHISHRDLILRELGQ
jgi:hypothetical protein